MERSLTEKIMLAVMQQLDQAGKPGGVSVNRHRWQTIEPTELPMISVYAGTDTDKARDMQDPTVDQALLLVVRKIVGGDDGALDPLAVWERNQLHADPEAGDWFLAGLAVSIRRLSLEWSGIERKEGQFTQGVSLYEIRYQTERRDLTRAA